MVFLIFLPIFLVEAVFTTIPLVYIFFMAYYIRKKSINLFIFGLFAGALLDIMNVREYGLTSMVYAFVFFLSLLYERKYEMNTVPFMFLSSFFGSIVLLSIYGASNIVLQSIAAGVIGVIFFNLMGRQQALAHR